MGISGVSLACMTAAGSAVGSEFGRGAVSATERLWGYPRNAMVRAKYRGAMGGAAVGALAGAAAADEMFGDHEAVSPTVQ
jgi:hypothetical protein